MARRGPTWATRCCSSARASTTQTSCFTKACHRSRRCLAPWEATSGREMAAEICSTRAVYSSSRCSVGCKEVTACYRISREMLTQRTTLASRTCRCERRTSRASSASSSRGKFLAQTPCSISFPRLETSTTRNSSSRLSSNCNNLVKPKVLMALLAEQIMEI